MLAPLGRDTQKRACTPVEIDRGKQVGLRAVVFTIEAAATTAVFLEQVHDIEVGVGAVPHQPQIPPPAIAGHAGVAGARAQAGEAVLEGQIGHDTVVVAEIEAEFIAGDPKRRRGDVILDLLAERADRGDAHGLEVVFEAHVIVARDLRLQRRVGGAHDLADVIHREAADEIGNARTADGRGIVRADGEVRDRLVAELQVREPIDVVRLRRAIGAEARFRRGAAGVLEPGGDPCDRLLETHAGRHRKIPRELHLALHVPGGNGFAGLIIVLQRVRDRRVEVRVGERERRGGVRKLHRRTRW
jgi:hypothetical protein